jgi:hypothetical protein
MSEKNLLDVVYIAKPCDARWEDMPGSDRMRFCSLCSKNVYNIADMTTNEAELFLEEQGNSACIGIFRRKDGTVIVDDCPVGLRKARDAAKHAMRMCASIFGFLLSMLCLNPNQVHATETGSAAGDAKSDDDHFRDGPLAGVGWGHLDDNFNFNSVHSACKLSRFVVIAEYRGYENTGTINLFDPPVAHFRIIQTLKGPALPDDLPIRYAFTDKPAEVMPVDWKFSEDMMPEKGSQFILCIWSFVKDCAETYNWSYGRFPLTAANLQAVCQEIQFGTKRSDVIDK